MGSMGSCSRLCGAGKTSFTLSLFSSRGMQQTGGLMHCIENFACLHHLRGTIRSLYVSVYFRALGNASKRQIGHKICVVCGGNLFVGDGVYPPEGGGNRHLATVPPGLGGNRRPWGGGGDRYELC